MKTRNTNTARNRWPPGRVKLKALIEDAILDAYGESEQRTGFYTMLDEHLVTPFVTEILGASATVERVHLTADEQIVAICRRGRSRQAISILDLPLPDPRPDGAEWIEAYRQWARSGRIGQ
jgi:Calcium binding